MNYLYVVVFWVFDRTAIEYVLWETQLTRAEIETKVKKKTFDSALNFKITEYQIKVQKETEIL